MRGAKLATMGGKWRSPSKVRFLGIPDSESSFEAWAHPAIPLVCALHL